MILFTILLLFFLSGASALIYEVLWARQLGLVFGATTQAASAVLVAYMVGLALGAAIGGRWADRSPNPLRLYGVLEAGIGVAGLAVPWAITNLPGFYGTLAGTDAGIGIGLALLRFGLAFALLLLPTLLMGATFPILVRALGSAGTRPLGHLYAANTLGAVVGTLATGYALLPRLGVSGTAALGATLNLCVALAALLTAGRLGEAGPALVAASPNEERASAFSRAVPAAVPLTLLVLSGLTTLGTEILWTRVLVFPLWSTTYAFTTMLGAFLAGLALGGVAAARWLAAASRPWRVLAWLQGLLGLTLLIPVAGAEAMNAAFASLQNWTVPSPRLSIGAHVAAVFLLLLPQTLLAGATYPFLLQATVSGGRRLGGSVGKGIFANTLGAAVGAVAAAYGTIPALGILPSFGALAMIWIALGALLAFRARGLSWLPASLAATTAAALVAAVVWGPMRATRPDPFNDLTVSGFPSKGRLLTYREGVESTLLVTEFPNGRRVLRINGFEASGRGHIRYTYMHLMAHLPLLLHPAPKDALVISFGTGTTAGAAARHPLASLDLVDLDPGVFAVANLFADVNRGVLGDPRVRVIVNDGRNFVAVTPRMYDVITLEPMPPTFAGIVNLYSREFYATARAHLRPGGLLCQWVPFHLLSRQETLEVLRTFQDVFPESTLWVHEGSGFVIGKAGGSMTVDAALLAAATARLPGVRDDLESAGITGLVPLLDVLVWSPETLRDATAQAAVVTDDFPSLEFPEIPFRIPQSSKLLELRQAHGLQLVFAVRQANRPRATNVPPALEAALTAYRETHEYRELAVAAFWLGRPDAAEAAFRAGLAACRTDSCRAAFFSDLAQLAERRGGGRAGVGQAPRGVGGAGLR